MYGSICGGKSKQLFSTSVMTSFTSIMVTHQKSFLRVRYARDKAPKQRALGLRHKIVQFSRVVSTIHVSVPFCNSCLALRAWAGVIRSQRSPSQTQALSEVIFRDYNVNIFCLLVQGNSTRNGGATNHLCAGNIHVPQGKEKVFLCKPKAYGRYVSIRLSGQKKYVTLCEVKVYPSYVSSKCLHIFSI